MNERIKELAVQASNEYLSEMEPVTDTLSTAKRNELAQKAKQAGIGIIPHGFSEKFAELIVRDCLDVIKGELFDESNDSDPYENGYQHAVLRIQQRIEGNFGVKE